MAYWITPTGHNDPDSAWSNEAYAYDDDTNTYAHPTVGWTGWSSFLELTIYPILASKVRFTADHVTSYCYFIDLDVYRDGAWVDVYQGTYLDRQWVEKSFTEGTVTKARLRFANAYATPYNFAKLWEFDFWGTDPPSAPTSLECETATNPMAVTDLTPEFTAIGGDPKPSDTLTHAYIQVGTSVSGSNMWDSGWIDISDFTQGNRCAEIPYAGSALSKDGRLYYWRIKFKDSPGTEGAWSTEASHGSQRSTSRAELS